MSGEEELAKKTEGLSVSDGPDGSSGAVDPGSKANAEDLQERDEASALCANRLLSFNTAAWHDFTGRSLPIASAACVEAML